MEKIVETYYGKDLGEAYYNCKTDEKYYAKDVIGFIFLSAKKEKRKKRCFFNNKKGELLEAWKFEIMLVRGENKNVI